MEGAYEQDQGQKAAIGAGWTVAYVDSEYQTHDHKPVLVRMI